MDTQSLQFDPSTNQRKKKKLSKRERNFLRKQRRYERGKTDWAPLDKSKCITFHLIHRSTNDPLLNIPDEQYSEWVLEPEVHCRADFERVQHFFGDNELEDTLPHHYRTDEFIEKTSAKSMPILPSQRRRTSGNALGAIYEDGGVGGDDYDYEQHFRSIDEANYKMQNDGTSNTPQNKKKRAKDGIEILEQYMFEEDYESDSKQEHKEQNDDDNDDEDALPEHLKEYEPQQPVTDKQLETDPNYRDYMDLLLESEDDEEHEEEDEKKQTNEHQAQRKNFSYYEEECVGDLQDDFVLHAMGVDEDEFKRIQLGEFEPYGARFAKWTEMDQHFDKYNENTIDPKSESLYDQTISRLMNIQNAKHMNSSYLDDIHEAPDEQGDSDMDGQFDDAESDEEEEEDEDMEVAYDPDMSLLDNQFEIMLHKQYGDELIGELDDEHFEELENEFDPDIFSRFREKNDNKKDNLRYQYYVYLKNKRRRIRRSLKKANRAATLQLMGVTDTDRNVDDEKQQQTQPDKQQPENEEKEQEAVDEESDEVIYFSDSDSQKQDEQRPDEEAAYLRDEQQVDQDEAEEEDEKEINIEDLDSDDERRIDAEIEREFKKKPPPKWDVESILSTRTNHENHPTELRLASQPKPKHKNVVKLNKDQFIEIGGDGRIKQETMQSRLGLQSIHEDEQSANQDEQLDSKMASFSFGNIGGSDAVQSQPANGGKKQIVFEFKQFDDDDQTEHDDENEKEEMNANGTQEDNKEDITAYSERRKGETKEEKRLRKKLKKELKQQRRKEKKANKEAFKQATKRQSKLNVTQSKAHSGALRL